MAFDDEFPRATFPPTYAPTLSPVSAAIQTKIMVLFLLLIFAIIGCSCCMTKEWCWLHKCLQDWLACLICQRACKKKPNVDGSDSSTSWMKMWSFLKPIGAKGSAIYVFQFQLGLLLWKRYVEVTRNVAGTVLYFFLPSVGLLVMLLLYASFADPAFSNAHSSGTIEILASPMLFIVTVQLTTSSLVVEKGQKLKESMRMMGLREAPYWVSYIISDACVMGCLLSLLLTVLSSVMKLYHNLGAGYHHDGQEQDFVGFFFLLFLSTFALTTMAFAISALFDTPQTASMVSFTVILASVIMFIVFLVASPDLFDTAAKQTLWCLFPPMALQMGILTKFTIKSGFFYLLNQKMQSSTTLGTVYQMLILDCFIYSFLAWYLAQVVPSEVGVRRHPLFLLTPSYWSELFESLKLSDKTQYSELTQPLPVGEGESGDQLSYPCEVDALGREPKVSVRNLVKKFGEFVAVDHLGFDMYEDEIFALLGHNGAGKTTTINILTGMFPPTDARKEGTQAKVYDTDLFQSLEAARGYLGVCPQHDILFDSLTSKEHIAFFSLLKGKTETWQEATDEAASLLNHFHLHERADHFGSELSGGMKRKLSTAIALCGGSKFVVLDEPTAGMDPLARRELWDLLKELKVGKTMLLTTHYMDEADVLGDRVGIMSRGHLRCLGSPNFLKKEYGSGYKLCCTMGDALTKLKPVTTPLRTSREQSEASQNSTATPAATHNSRVKQGGRGAGGQGSSGVFENQTRSNLESHPVVVNIAEYIHKHIPSAAFVTNESSSSSIVFVFPFDTIGSFGSFFERLDQDLNSLQIVGYGLTITSLEEVFLKVGGDEDLVGEMASGQGVAGGSGSLTKQSEERVVSSSLSEQTPTNQSNGSSKQAEKYSPLVHSEDNSYQLLVTQVFALWRKRVTFASNDLVKFLPTIMLPTAAITTAFILNTLNVYGAQFRPGGLNSNLITALICTAGAIPVVALIVEHVVSERISKLRNVLTVMGCDVRSYWLGTLSGDLSILILSVISATIAAGVCTSLKPENVIDDDHPLNRMDDDHPMSDWFTWRLPLALFLFTYQICSFSYFCSHWFPSAKLAIAFMPFFCIVLIMGAGAFTGMAIFGLGRNGFELIQPDQSDIIGGMLWFIAVVSPHGALCMALLHIGDVCRSVHADVCVVPPLSASCLLMACEGTIYLYMTYRIDLRNFLPIESKANPANDPTKKGYLVGEDPNVAKETESVLSMEPYEIEREHQPFIGTTGDTFYRNEVNPVLGEAVRTAVYLDQESGLSDPYSLRVAGLRKLYPPKKPGEKPLAAVANLSLRIPRGEVFGLLGANGAGKTTAISMIMRSTYPNFGDIHVEGYSVLKDFKLAAKHLGVVTQHNTLWDRLSCKDHLRLFAQIRGVPPDQVEDMVKRTIIELELGPYQDKLAMQLSGGMKRKLCVAVALIGDPKLVLLDEPSAGLDPVSRRNLWDTLIKTMSNRAVVLTSHSMEEVEALCTRIGIMVKGKLRALGTPQELKLQLGVGYEIAVKAHGLVGKPSDVGSTSINSSETVESIEEKVSLVLQEQFPSISVISNNGGLVTFSIPASEMKVGAAFALLEELRETRHFDYAISQPTLEQVFVATVMEHSGGERNLETEKPMSTSESAASEEGQGITLKESILSSDVSTAQDQETGNQETEDEDFNTGIPDTWCGLNKRSHRFMAIAAGFLAWLGYQTIFRARIGYVFLPFLIAFIASVIGCAGCCCLIPADPDEKSDKD